MNEKEIVLIFFHSLLTARWRKTWFCFISTHFFFTVSAKRKIGREFFLSFFTCQDYYNRTVLARVTAKGEETCFRVTECITVVFLILVFLFCFVFCYVRSVFAGISDNNPSAGFGHG